MKLLLLLLLLSGCYNTAEFNQLCECKCRKNGGFSYSHDKFTGTIIYCKDGAMFKLIVNDPCWPKEAK
jgi:hypothetical protein